MLNLSNMERIGGEILEILKEYLEIPSFSNTENENLVDEFFQSFFSKLNYFKKNPDYFGSYEIPGDKLKRSVNWGFVKGHGKDTVVMIHHTDVVNVDNFAPYEDFAFYPDRLKEVYLKDDRFFDKESREDFLSEKWLFGRGSADMKGGGAIQLALLKYYSEYDGIIPNILVMGVPDEENHSLGMRNGVVLMDMLKEKFDLDYKLMINSEPHQRMRDENGVISQGSIGKLNVFVHVKGVLTHGGKALEGVNPNGMMGRIVSDLDLNEELVDLMPGEMSIPPTWVYLRDNKKHYDISFPESSYGILNILNFYTSPEEVLRKIKKICGESLRNYMESVNRMREKFSNETNRHWQPLECEAKIFTLREFLREAGIEGVDNYPEDIEKVLKTFRHKGPLVIIGILPPYYPGVTNKNQEKLLSAVNEFTLKMWKQPYDNRQYFTGISDLSYSKLNADPKEIDNQMMNMVGWKSFYHIPFEQIGKLSMESINVGPWGKDFHRPTERVYIEDLINRTPLIIDNLIKLVAQRDCEK